MFGKLENGILTYVPRSYKRNDGALITGFDKAPEEVWRAEGFLPVVSELAVPDNINSYVPKYEVVDGVITLVSWVMVDPSFDSAGIVKLLFVKACTDGDITDTDIIADNMNLFPVWTSGSLYPTGSIVQDAGKLYRTIIDITAGQAHFVPSESPSIWVAISDPTQEWPEYIAPTGAHDAYALGDKVSYNGGKYISIFNGANIWPPTIGVSSTFWEYAGPL